MKNNSKFFRSLKFMMLGCMILSSMYIYADEKIQFIEVEGNKRIETLTVKKYLGLKVGDVYNVEKQSQALKSLYSTELFSNINIKFVNGHLIVVVEEPSFISKIEFRGNHKLRTATLSKELLTQVGESINEGYIQLDIEKIRELYKRSGRFLVNIDPKIEKQDNNRVKIVFQITEGPKTGVRKINFSGNKYYTSSELKSIIITKETKWFSFLETNDTYDPDRMEYDKELIKEFYQSVGFADCNVISAVAELAKTREYFVLTYSIEEGNRYNLGEITLNNNILEIESSKLSKFITVRTGQIFNMKILKKIAENISNDLAKKGYPDVNVYPDVSEKKDGIVNVKFIINKADKVFIDTINITGNVKTYDKVVRRELKIQEGDIFNYDKVSRGEHNIRNLDYFDKLLTKITPTSKRDKYDLNIMVSEKSTASIGLEVGYNTSIGLFSRLSFAERNLVGSGKYLYLGGTFAKRNNSYNLSVTEPYFLDRNLSLSGSVFNSSSGKNSGFGQLEQNYSLKSLGSKVSLGYQITDDLSHDVNYTIKRDKLSSEDPGSSRFLLEQMGRFTTSSLEHSLTYDMTDNKYLPKSGYLLVGTQEYAGIGGNAKHLKHELEAKNFYSWHENKYTVKLGGSVGDIRGINNHTVRISDRFNLGDYTLRGFSSGGLGPRDKITQEGLGGQQYYTVSAELSFPLGLPEEFGLIGSVFADAGSVWGVTLNKKSQYNKTDFYNDKALRASVGFGFTWITRLAPIRVDWGFPVKCKKYDDKQRLHIKFSTHL